MRLHVALMLILLLVLVAPIYGAEVYRIYDEEGVDPERLGIPLPDVNDPVARDLVDIREAWVEVDGDTVSFSIRVASTILPDQLPEDSSYDITYMASAILNMDGRPVNVSGMVRFGNTVALAGCEVREDGELIMERIDRYETTFMDTAVVRIICTFQGVSFSAPDPAYYDLKVATQIVSTSIDNPLGIFDLATLETSGTGGDTGDTPDRGEPEPPAEPSGEGGIGILPIALILILAGIGLAVYFLKLRG